MCQRGQVFDGVDDTVGVRGCRGVDQNGVGVDLAAHRGHGHGHGGGVRFHVNQPDPEIVARFVNGRVGRCARNDFRFGDAFDVAVVITVGQRRHQHGLRAPAGKDAARVFRPRPTLVAPHHVDHHGNDLTFKLADAGKHARVQRVGGRKQFHGFTLQVVQRNVVGLFFTVVNASHGSVRVVFALHATGQHQLMFDGLDGQTLLGQREKIIAHGGGPVNDVGFDAGQRRLLFFGGDVSDVGKTPGVFHDEPHGVDPHFF